jgi:hypothetical protein
MNKGKKSVEPQPEFREPVSPPTKAGAGMLCQPHRERTGANVPADIVTVGTPMCRECFRGSPLPPSPKLFAQKPVAERSAHL